MDELVDAEVVVRQAIVEMLLMYTDFPGAEQLVKDAEKLEAFIMGYEVEGSVLELVK